MSTPLFEKICIDFADILQQSTLTNMLKVVNKQSKTEEAKKRTDFLHYKDYNQDESCPMYLGLFVEWYAYHWFEHFGFLKNISQVQLSTVTNSTTVDLGVDAQGITSVNINKKGRITPIKGSPVYIQIKGTLNKSKTYCANDGSRLPNFVTNATTSAITSGYAYQARYILFTTGNGVHHTLRAMWNEIVEVINYQKITELADYNCSFINNMRKSVNLPKIIILPSETDEESQESNNE